jgi:integrase
MSSVFKTALAAARDCAGLHLCQEHGTAMHQAEASCRRVAATTAARVSDLRHTAATLLLEAGMHPRVVAERLGHSTPSLVMNTYGDVIERMQTEATAVLDRVLGG